MRDQLSEVATRMDGDGISVVTAVQQGRPGQRIALTADEESFDLVVMSSRGLAGAGRGAFGGVSEAVIHGCSVPVLVVPPAAAEAG
jgi:nucleotide-binding universal stress UspA family protein